ncbi:outer membrane efflux protein [Chitinispirillum alkaliphilum]|nr:outer membrane efflux protein [Chitinispirillum alkaliphilum]
MIYSALLILAAFTFLSAGGLTERDVVLKALSLNTDIRVYQLESQRDSLTMLSVSSARLPQFSINLNSVLDDSLSISRATGTISQRIPGGGTLFGTAEQNLGSQRGGSLRANSTKFSAGIEQPLLRNAWSNSPVDVEIQITSLNNEILSTQREQQILSTLSDIRNFYWSVYEQRELDKISQRRYEQAKRHLFTERQRFALGEASQLDTLSASLQVVNAQRDLLSSQNRTRNTLLRLASVLRTEIDSIVLPDSIEVTIPDIPEPEEFLRLARRYDPEGEVLERMQQLTSLRIQQSRNALLPELNVRASYTHEERWSEFFPQELPGNSGSIEFVLNYSLPATSARAEKKKHELSLTMNEYSTEQHEVDREFYFDELLHKWQQDKLQLHFANLTAELAQKQYEAVKQGYELGTEDRLSLINAQNELASAEIDAVQAKIEMKRFQIVFEEITGKLFEQFGVHLK